MNVLFVTYWYPNSKNASEATFVRAHAKAVAKYCLVAVLALDPTLRLMQARIGFDGTVCEVRVGLPSQSRILRALLSQVCFLRGFWVVRRKIGIRPDVINAVILPAALFSVVAGRLTHVPVVVTEHSSTVGTMSLGPVCRFMARIIYESAAAVVSVSEGLDAVINRIAPKARRVVVGNAVEETNLSWLTACPAKDPGACLLFVGRIVPEKGLIDLFRALLLLKQRRESVPGLDVIGSGPEAGKAKRFVVEHRLDNVRFRGVIPHEQVFEWMRRAKAVVIPSYYETFGLVAVEAVVSCAPVIATGVGVVPELARLGLVRVFSPGDIQGLADAIRRLDTEALPANTPGRAYVIARFGCTEVGREYYRLYRQLLRHCGC